MATEIIDIEVQSNISQVSDHSAALAENLKRAGKEGKQAGKEISGGMQAANAGAGMLDRFTGGLATKFMDVGKAAMKSGKAMKTALISSGIGLAVALVGILVANWDAIGEALGFINKDLERQKELNEENLRVVDSQVGLLEKQIKFNKERGIANEENLKKHKELLLQKQGLLSVSILALETQILTEESVERSLLTGEKALGLMDSFKRGLGILFSGDEGVEIIDTEEVKRVNDLKIALNKLKAEALDLKMILDPADADDSGGGIDQAQVLADFKAALAEKTAAAEADTDVKRIERERKKHIAELDKLKVNTKEKAKLKEELNKLYDDRITEIEDNRYWEKRIADNDTWNEEQQEKLNQQKAADEAMAALKEENALAEEEDMFARAKKELDFQKIKDEEALKEHDNFLKLKEELDIKYDKKYKKLEKDKVAFAKLSTNDQIAAFGNLAGALSGLAGDNKELAAASAIIDTYAGANKALAQGGVIGFATGAAIIAAGLANVQKIYETDVPSGGSSGASAMPPAPQMMSGAFELTGGQEVEPARAYVVSDDITANQNKLAIIRRRATI
tara:strand:- start:352 stop:2046 length:1695 start_codon:yes stop_codon:yes gene_type:complete